MATTGDASLGSSLRLASKVAAAAGDAVVRHKHPELRHPLTMSGGAPSMTGGGWSRRRKASQASVPDDDRVASTSPELDMAGTATLSMAGTGGLSLASTGTLMCSPKKSLPPGKVRFSGTWLGPLGRPYDERHVPGEWTSPRCFLPTLPTGEDNAAVVAHFRSAVQRGDVQTARLLLMSGLPADVVLLAERKRTALHIATERNDTMMCKLLLDFSADPDALDEFKWTPSDLARECDHLQLVHLFAQHMERRRRRTSVVAEGSRRVSVDGPALWPQAAQHAKGADTQTVVHPARLFRERAAAVTAQLTTAIGQRAGPELSLEASQPGFMQRPPCEQSDGHDG